MQTLGLSESTPRSESRLKSLFWPSVESGADVDYLGVQGYWVCTVLGVANLLVALAQRDPFSGVVLLLFFYLGGVGVRQGSRYAAAVVSLLYLIDMVASGIGVVRVLFLALLLSNLRATWIASAWKPDSEVAAMPPRLAGSWGDRFTDRLPLWLWPKVRHVYYVLAFIVLVLTGAGFVMSLLGVQ